MSNYCMHKLLTEKTCHLQVIVHATQLIGGTHGVSEWHGSLLYGGQTTHYTARVLLSAVLTQPALSYLITW